MINLYTIIKDAVMNMSLDKISLVLISKISLKTEVVFNRFLQPLQTRRQISVFLEIASQVHLLRGCSRGQNRYEKLMHFLRTLERWNRAVFKRILIPAIHMVSGSYFHVLKNVSIFCA